VQRLQGRHVVVTGGGRGIGRAIAERLAQEGAELTLLARNLDALQEVASKLGAAAAACDIRDHAPPGSSPPTRAESPARRSTKTAAPGWVEGDAPSGRPLQAVLGRGLGP
jgi:NAD(P)-dependent dehydrogenase (short-subunit alcohol dehydrogenase family)